ncbi:MAG: ArsC/Spx/MgsR family protein [Leptolyngbyaceae cyanobacterium bins.59]|nr:ArsC/Spx/MgsR family protein [Leptolyngbyaceae cyanobacterium bins.59]
MATIHFYEKPGCINNTKQKTLLQSAGHRLEMHNLLTEPWTPDRLRMFFGDRPVADWFNRSAPAVKAGEVVPESLDAATALSLMVQNPLLIRRPLMQVDDRYEVGFDTEVVDAWVGLSEGVAVRGTSQAPTIDLEGCPRASHAVVNIPLSGEDPHDE